MFRNDLLLFIYLRWYNIRVYSTWWYSSTTSRNITSRMPTGSTSTSIFGIIYKLLSLIWLLSWCIIETTIAAMLGSNITRLWFATFYCVRFTVNWLLLVVISILTCQILSIILTVWSLCRSLDSIRSLNHITTFSLRAASKYWVTSRIPHVRRDNFGWVIWRISYSIVTWYSLWWNLICYHSMLRSSLLTILCRANDMRRLGIS